MPENYNESSDNGLGKSYEYDLQNRLIKVIDEANVVVEKNLYDLNGNLYKAIDGDNYITGLSDDTRDGTLYQWNGRTSVQLLRYMYVKQKMLRTLMLIIIVMWSISLCGTLFNSLSG